MFEHLNAGIEEKLRGKYPDYFEGYVIKIQNIIPVENILSYNFLSCKEEETAGNKETETKFDDFTIKDLLLIYKRFNDFMKHTNNIEETVSIEERMYRNGVVYGVEKCIKMIGEILEEKEQKKK